MRVLFQHIQRTTELSDAYRARILLSTQRICIKAGNMVQDLLEATTLYMDRSSETSNDFGPPFRMAMAVPHFGIWSVSRWSQSGMEEILQERQANHHSEMQRTSLGIANFLVSPLKAGDGSRTWGETRDIVRPG
jgi:hypothetical protein